MRDVKAHRKAFSLVELIVVVAIIAILMAIAMPVLKNSAVDADRTHCTNSLRVVGNGYLLYATSYAGSLPSRLTASAQTTGNLLVQLPGESFKRGSAESYGTRYDAYRRFSEPVRHPAGTGHLVSDDILEVRSLPTVWHCPSLNNLSDPTFPGAGMDKPYTGATYWPTHPRERITMGYAYRGVSYEYWTPRIKPGHVGPPTLQGDAHGNFALITDMHDQRFRGYSSKYNEHGGYVTAFADGGVQWIPDEDYSVDAIILTATRKTGDGRGSLNGGGAGDGSLDEAIFNRLQEMRQ